MLFLLSDFVNRNIVFIQSESLCVFYAKHIFKINLNIEWARKFFEIGSIMFALISQ